jgi:hypothetical protein
VSVPQEEHEIKWAYTKGASGRGGRDCAWLDEVVFTPGTEDNVVFPADLAGRSSAIALWEWANDSFVTLMSEFVHPIQEIAIPHVGDSRWYLLGVYDYDLDGWLYSEWFTRVGFAQGRWIQHLTIIDGAPGTIGRATDSISVPETANRWVFLWYFDLSAGAWVQGGWVWSDGSVEFRVPRTGRVDDSRWYFVTIWDPVADAYY